MIFVAKERLENSLIVHFVFGKYIYVFSKYIKLSLVENQISFVIFDLQRQCDGVFAF